MSNDKPLVFECAWEVANKVGGIYTVIRSKAPVSVQQIGDDNYFCMGIYNGAQARTEVEPCEPKHPHIAGTLQQMRDNGIRVHYGKWLIDGNPNVILFDIGSAWHHVNNWKGDFWVNTHIGIKLITHFHEWQAGVGLVLIRTRQLPIGTVFTTHATLLGRYLCAGAMDFYNNLPNFDCEAEADKRQIYHRYCLERAATHAAHVFTTVSRVTGLEAEHLLKRKPDVIVPNGLNVIKFAALHEFQNLHAVKKEKINNFIRGHFYGHYDFDPDKTLYFFLAGRYEYTNKGADMFIESLARLNHRLKVENVDVTVVAFIIMPAPTNNYNVESLKGQAVVKALRDTVAEVNAKIGRRIFEACLKGTMPNKEELMTKEDEIHLKQNLYSMTRDTLPPIVTHNLENEAKDPIMTQLKNCQMFNQRSDRVKVVFHPEFLKSTSPLLPLDYDEFVRGCHMGVFPSYYEPWGYTPAECTVMGVPSITSNLSGFGCFMEEHVQDPNSYGIYVVDRRLKSPDESLDQMVDIMVDFCKLDRRQRINLRNRTERLSDILDWKRLGIYYQRSRDLAMRRAYGHITQRNEDNPVPKVLAPKSPRPPSQNLPDEDE